jgi:hypothetical protein
VFIRRVPLRHPGVLPDVSARARGELDESIDGDFAAGRVGVVVIEAGLMGVYLAVFR